MSFLLLLVQSPRQATGGHNYLTILGQKEADILVLYRYYTGTSIHIFIKRKVLKKLVTIILLPQHLLLKTYQRDGNYNNDQHHLMLGVYYSFFFIQWRHITNHYEPIGYQNTALHTKTETNWASYD